MIGENKMDDILEYLIFEEVMLKDGQKTVECPNCFKIVEVPEETNEFDCSSCGKKIVVKRKTLF